MQKHDRSTFVYAMLNRRNGYVKLGRSDDPKYREKTLQSEEPEVELVFAFRCDGGIERDLHSIFKDKRVRGEWFDLSEADLHGAHDYIMGFVAETEESLWHWVVR